MPRSRMKSIEKLEGERIETKVERLTTNKEPIKDGAPEIFTERKDGVIAAYNIRTDRWEIAAEAMDVAAKSIAAKREARMKAAQEKFDEAVEDGKKNNTKTGDAGGSKESGA